MKTAGPTIAACTVAIGLGAALGFVPGFVATELQSDLQISRAEVGLIVSLHFGATGVASILAGRLTDRLGARKVVTFDLLLVAGCAVVAAMSGRYAVMLITSVVAGTGYAVSNAGTNLAIAGRVARRRWTLALSIKTAGVPAMVSVGAAATPAIANRWSWQAVWIGMASLAAVSAIATWLVLDDVTSELRRADERTPPPRGMWWFAVAAFLLVGGSQPLFSWIVPYLQEEFAVSPGRAGAIASVAAVAGVVHLVVNGMLSDRRGASRRIPRITVLTGLSAIGVLLIWAGPTVGVSGIAIGELLGVAAQLAAIGTMHAAVADRAPHAVATATGMTMTGYYLGALLSPVGFGAIVDLSGSYAWGWFALAMMLVASIPAWRRGGRVPIAT